MLIGAPEAAGVSTVKNRGLGSGHSMDVMMENHMCKKRATASTKKLVLLEPSA